MFSIESVCESDVCLDDYDKEILSILKDLQCPQNPVKSQSQISVPSVWMKQYRLSGSFVSDIVKCPNTCTLFEKFEFLSSLQA